MQVDAVDRHILRLLQENADRSASEVAQAVGVSAGACWRRIERLEAAGVILGHDLSIDPRALGFEVQVFLRITLDKTASDAFPAFVAAAREIPNVESIETLLGRVDIRMDVIARDLEHYSQIYQDRILALPHIADIEALMLVSELKSTQALAI